MKQLFLTVAAVCLSLFTISTAFAQIATKTTDTKSRKKAAAYISIDHAPPANPANPLYINDINTRAVRNFEKEYKGITNARWYSFKTGYIVKFGDGPVKTTVAYTHSGDWVYSIKRYTEKEMPHDVRALVKSTYYDYKITLVEEIEQPNLEGTVYVVHIEDDHTLALIRVCNGSMEMMQHYHKQQPVLPQKNTDQEDGRN